MDAATGLLYVGNGQYYDPRTGRFLTREAQPGKTNPYVPWGGGGPLGSLVGPLALIVLLRKRRKGEKRSRVDYLLLGLLVALAVGMSLTGCDLFGDDGQPTSEEAPQTPNQTQETGKKETQQPNTVATDPGAPLETQTTPCPEPPTNTATPSLTPTPVLTSGYYIPTESQARKWGGGIDYPIPAPTWLEDKDTYLVEYDYAQKNSIGTPEATQVAWSKNWAGGAPAQYANESLLYNRSYTCLQGSAQLDNLHYIACDTDYTWNGFYKDDVNHTREDLIGFRWVLEDEDSLLNKLEPFKTVAVCPSSALKGTIQLEGLPGEALTMLKTHGNPDAIFEVIDIGYGLCRDNNEEGVEMIDIFTGIGEQAYDDTSVFGEKPVQVYTIDLDN